MRGFDISNDGTLLGKIDEKLLRIVDINEIVSTRPLQRRIDVQL